jgi:uncharacterized protein (DUF433 family)
MRQSSCDNGNSKETIVAVPHPLITTDPETLGGLPVFKGTRVPVKTLIDYLEGGDRLDDFLDDFPTVTREHAIAVLEIAKEALDGHARVA